MEIEKDVWIADSAVVEGDVRLGAQVSVWHGAVVRGDSDAIVVGAQSNIQDNCVLHADPGYPVTIGERVTVGHGAIVHGCSIEDDVLIGMGAIVLNGARVGKHSIIGAGALVNQGMEIPEGSVAVGCPAKVRRNVNEADKKAHEENIAEYLHLASARM